MDSGLSKIELYASFLYEGMLLKGELFTETGERIAGAKEPLSREIIDYVKNKGVKKVYYQKPVYIEKVENPIFSKEIIEKAFSTAEETVFCIHEKKHLPQKEIDEAIESMVERVSKIDTGAILNLLELKEHDEYTYTHSINVAMLTVLFTRQLNWKEDAMKRIGVGAMLHDMGKMMVPQEILTKPGKLEPDEFEVMKKHTVYGYEILKGLTNYGDDIQKIALLHHECYDGKGYPFGLAGEKIDDYSQIVSIVDYFDAVSTKRAYKTEAPLWNALLMINKNAGSKFIPRFAIEFINKMPVYLGQEAPFKNGDFVILNTGEIGEITDVSQRAVLKPVVSILINSKREVMRNPIRIMLESDPTRWLETIIVDPKLLGIIQKMRDGVKKEVKIDPPEVS